MSLRYAAEVLPYHDYPLDVALAELRGLGFREVNLWSSAAPLARHVNPGDDVAEIKAALARHDMTACGLTMYGKTREEMLERVRLAHDLEIDTAIFDCEANYPDFINNFLPPLVEAAATLGVRVAVENHLTVPFSHDFESGGNEDQRWSEGVDSFGQIKRLIKDIDHPYLGVCVAPPHLWVMNETITEVLTFLAERRRLFYYYIWDIDRAYRHGVDGLNFGPGEKQLPRHNGTLDHAVLLGALARLGYTGPASLKCHGTQGWALEKVTAELRASNEYVRDCLSRA